jgi:predicted RND superfamily exporter protein
VLDRGLNRPRSLAGFAIELSRSASSNGIQIKFLDPNNLMNNRESDSSNAASTRDESAAPISDNVVEVPPLDQPSTFLQKYSTLILCLALFAIPIVGQAAVRALKVYSTDVMQWLPSRFEQAETYLWFKDEFGIDEMMVISWPGCTITDPRVEQLQTALELAEMNGQRAFVRVTSGPRMMKRIMNGGVSERYAAARLKGLVIGPDEETTCIVATPAEHVLTQRRQAYELVLQIAEESTGLSAADLKLGGPTVDGAVINIESQLALRRYLGASVLVVFLLTWYRMKDLPLTIMVIFFASVCAMISLAVLYATGGKMNLTMIMLPTLIFILGVSGCVHMVNYYRKASTRGYGLASADQAVKDARYPIILSALTTACGLVSLATSQVNPIRQFGIYSAAGVLCSLVIFLLVLPATLYLLKGRISKFFSPKGKLTRRERITGVSRSTSILVNWVCRTHWWVVLPSLIGVALLATGVLKLHASVKLQSRFAQRTEIIKDYQWLEENLGPLVPMEVIIHFTPSSDLGPWEQMRTVRMIERAVRQTTAVNATLSAGTFAPRLPSGRSMVSTFERKTVLDQWKQQIPALEENGLVSMHPGDNYWRISLRVDALNDIDYGQFLESVSTNVQHQLEDLNMVGVESFLTGGIPLVYKAQHQILRDLSISFVTAFVFISIILMVVLRSVRTGLVAMIPNVFPPLVVFGTMGWLGRSIEIGSVMTASVALGIAVDDTIHFLTWYQRGTMEGLSRFASIRHAFEHCAKAMIDTSLICGLGVAPFLFGVFMPTVNFALLLSVMLFTALVGDLILLPAILAGPAGILFRRRKTRKRMTNPAT